MVLISKMCGLITNFFGVSPFPFFMNNLFSILIQVEKANSGHPGAPMGCAPIAHVLWSKIMRYSPQNPKWVSSTRWYTFVPKVKIF